MLAVALFVLIFCCGVILDEERARRDRNDGGRPNRTVPPGRPWWDAHNGSWWERWWR